MSLCGIYSPTTVDWIDALGWCTTEKHLDAKENRFIQLNNLANIAGYVLSPLIGLIRLIVNTYFLLRDEDVDGEEWDKHEKNYLKTQIARGALELIGGGYFLWIPDLIATFKPECIYNENNTDYSDSYSSSYSYSYSSSYS